MKLSKRDIKLHEEAHALATCGRPLKLEERYFILENWREDARHINSKHGAFFTPDGLARDLSIEITGDTVIDLCAGIGKLAFQVREKAKRIVCVELNADYVEIGKAVLPEAEWICADVFSIPDVQEFDCAISNPPFGSIKTGGFKGKYTGSQFEYKLIEKASRLARDGVFIIPQMSAPFTYSGRREYTKQMPKKLERFMKQTGIELEPNCGIDTSGCADDWHGVSPICEIVLCTFQKIETSPANV